MANNLTGPEGVYNVKGSGPRVINVGSKGLWPRHERAEDWPVWPSMSSVTRLRVMSYLCQHEPVRTTAVARALGAPYMSVNGALWGLKSTWAVSLCESPVTKWCPSKRGGCYAIDWSATDTGRKWLWRYGWVTRRIGWDQEWQAAGYEGRLDLMPYDVLRDHAEQSLLRPTSLALMHYLTRCPPEQSTTMADHLCLNVSAVQRRVYAWWRLGWVEKTQNAVEPRSYLAPNCAEAAPRWLLTERGKHAVERHTAALRWASQTAGYTPPADDPFFNDE